MTRRSARGVCLLAALLAVVGCSNNPTSPTTTAAPAPFTSPLTVTFQGVVGPGGSASRAFYVQAAGTARATLSAIAPATPLSIGLGVPRADGTGCLLAVSSVASNGVSAEVTSAVVAGTFCVQVFAPAQTANAVNFTVGLVHP